METAEEILWNFSESLHSVAEAMRRAEAQARLDRLVKERQREEKKAEREKAKSAQQPGSKQIKRQMRASLHRLAFCFTKSFTNWAKKV